MYRYYEQATECYAYLFDVSRKTDNAPSHSELLQSSWFTRGWTLQELLAPSLVIFITADWEVYGHKCLQRCKGEFSNNEQHSRNGTCVLAGPSLNDAISLATQIPLSNLNTGYRTTAVDPVDVCKWVHHRETKRVEDLAYCLFGLLGVYMPSNYGEGEYAWSRLEREVRAQRGRSIASAKPQQLERLERERTSRERQAGAVRARRGSQENGDDDNDDGDDSDGNGGNGGAGGGNRRNGGYSRGTPPPSNEPSDDDSDDPWDDDSDEPSDEPSDDKSSNGPSSGKKKSSEETRRYDVMKAKLAGDVQTAPVPNSNLSNNATERWWEIVTNPSLIGVRATRYLNVTGSPWKMVTEDQNSSYGARVVQKPSQPQVFGHAARRYHFSEAEGCYYLRRRHPGCSSTIFCYTALGPFNLPD
jgi:hypothetical protein